MDNYLGVFGDSFAHCNPKYGGWPDQLAKLLDARFDNHAFSGTSIWWSYNKFLETYKNYTHIAMVFTNYHRWPILPEWLKGHHWVVDKKTLQDAHTLAADRAEMAKLVDIHSYIFDEHLEKFIYQHVFNEVNRICRENNIKLINIIPFEKEHEPCIDISNAHGSVIVRLIMVSANEIEEKDTYPELNWVFTRPDVRSCHLNNSNNTALAEIIYESFDQEPIIMSVDSHSKFSYDPLELVEFLNDNFN